MPVAPNVGEWLPDYGRGVAGRRKPWDSRRMHGAVKQCAACGDSIRLRHAEAGRVWCRREQCQAVKGALLGRR